MRQFCSIIVVAVLLLLSATCARCENEIHYYLPSYSLLSSLSPPVTLPLLLLPLRSAFEVEMGGERKCLAESVIAGAVVFGEWETSSISKKKRTW